MVVVVVVNVGRLVWWVWIAVEVATMVWIVWRGGRVCGVWCVRL